MKSRPTLSSGIVAALVAVMLVSSVAAPALAQTETLDSGVDTSADTAHNPWIFANVTKSVHEMGWSAIEYEDNSGDVVELPAEVNSTYDNPYQFTVSDVDASEFKAFPRDDVQNDASDRIIDADEWTSTTSDGTNVSPTVSNVTTAPNVEAVEVATSGGMGAGDTATFTYESFNITSDVDKRYLQLIVDVDTLDSAAAVDIRVHDVDGDYVNATITTNANYDIGNTVGNSTGDGYVFQQQIGSMAVQGSGDGSMGEIEKVDVQFQEADANIDIAALNVEKTGAWDLGTEKVDTDGDDALETRTIEDVNTSGDIAVESLDSLGAAFEGATIHDLTIPANFWASMADARPDEDVQTRWAELSDAEAFANFDKRLNDYRRLKLPDAYDLSYANTELYDYVAVPNSRYQTVEYATGVGGTKFDNISDSTFSAVTSSYDPLDDKISLTTSISAGEDVVVHYDYVLTQQEAENVMPGGSGTAGGGGAPLDDGSGGGLFDSVGSQLGALIGAVLGLLGIGRMRNGSGGS